MRDVRGELMEGVYYLSYARRVVGPQEYTARGQVNEQT